MTPYGWLPYNLAYQVYGDQLSQQRYYPEGQLPSQLSPYQLPLQGQHPELPPNYALGQFLNQLCPGFKYYLHVRPQFCSLL